MGSIRLSIDDTIGRPPAEVFAYIIDPDNTPAWNGAVDDVEMQGEPEVGTPLTATASFLGKSFTIEQTVTEYDANRRYAVKGDSPFPSELIFEFEPQGEEVTHLTMTMEGDPGKFFPMGGRLLKRPLKRSLNEDMARIKRNLERR